MIYSDKVMDHFMNPRNVGKIEDADGVGEVGNAKCGDIMKIYLKIEDDTVTDVIRMRQRYSVKLYGNGADQREKAGRGSRADK